MMLGSKGILPPTDAIRIAPLQSNSRNPKTPPIPQFCHSESLIRIVKLLLVGVLR